MDRDPVAWEEMKLGWAEHTKRSARYKFAAAADGTAEITLYGPIGPDFFGDGITAVAFKKELRNFAGAKTIKIRIDSPGGIIAEARAIYSLLVDSAARIEVFIDGFAASAASFIAMAGDSISIAEGGFIMIHEARGMARGTAAEMHKAGEVLTALTETIADTYVARTGNGLKKVRDWMQAETWFNGVDAVAEGFADAVIPNKTAPAKTTAYAYADAFEKFPRKLLLRSTRARNLMRKIERLANDAKAYRD